MAALTTDLIAIKRGANHYKTDIASIIALTASSVTVIDNLSSTSATAALSANQGKILNDKIDALGTVERTVANIAARDALTGLVQGDMVYVTDATGDATVTSGWAIYRWSGSLFTKMAEQESLDVAFTASLSYTASPTNGVVVSAGAGTDATITAADGTNAGLMLPAQVTKLGFISVTSAVDLNALSAASHAAVSLAGTATTNPLTISGQSLGFDIGALAVAP